MTGFFTKAELDELRAIAESRMGAVNLGSDVTVRRKTGDQTTDAGGYKRDAWADILVDVPFRLGKGTGYRTVTVGDVEIQVAARQGSFPVSTAGLHDDDLIEITAGENAGLVLQVIEATGADQQSALHVPVFEVQRPSEWDA